MTEKIQYFMSDLEHILKIGEIKEIHVADQNGRPVLRIECDEYKTVSAVPVKKAKKAKPEKKPKTMTEKLLTGAKDFLFNPERNRKPGPIRTGYNDTKEFNGNFGGGKSFGDGATFGNGKEFGK